MLTRDISKTKIGRGYYALACTPKGGIFMDGVLFRFDEEKFWYVQADGPFEDWLIAHSSNYDVQIKELFVLKANIFLKDLHQFS